MKPHKNLNAWIQSFGFVKEIYKLTDTFPPSEQFGLSSQMQRAAVSIPVNIAEGAGRSSTKEFIRFLYISLGSMTELDTLILLAVDLSLVPKDKADRLLKELDIIGKLIYGLIKKLKTKTQER